MIEFKNVSFNYAGNPVLSNVSFAMKDKEFVGILGPNGGGKSTFLRLALGLLKPTEGTIKVTEKKLSYISQTTSLSDHSFPANVEEIVSLGLVSSKIGFSFRKRKKKVEAILKEMDLWDLRKRLSNELSGGQLQRVKIAKALISEPELLLLDEPDAGMDEESHGKMVSLINSLIGKTSILFVSHHAQDLELADRIFFIEDGQILTYEEELKRGHNHVGL